MRLPLASTALVLALVGAGCERADPELSRGQVMALADNLVEHHELAWGPVMRVWPPAPGPDGRMWWQVDYPRADDQARLRSVLVDAETGWARFPPADFRPRVDLDALDGDEEADAGPLPPGTWILALDVPEPDAELVADLNARAADRGLPPLFVLREGRRGPAVVYGWTGAHGIARDVTVRRRVGELTAAETRWVDLAGQ